MLCRYTIGVLKYKLLWEFGPFVVASFFKFRHSLSFSLNVFIREIAKMYFLPMYHICKNTPYLPIKFIFRYIGKFCAKIHNLNM